EMAELLDGTLYSAEPTLRARALETAARVAQLTGDTEKACHYVAESLLVLDRYQVPLAEWQVHATARDLYLRTGNSAAAESHWKQAQEGARFLADSLSVDPTLRETFLAADPIRRLEL